MYEIEEMTLTRRAAEQVTDALNESDRAARQFVQRAAQVAEAYTQACSRVNTALQSTRQTVQSAAGTGESAAARILSNLRPGDGNAGSKAVEGTASALSKVTKSTRALAQAQRDLYGFDRITRVSAPKSSGSSRSSSGSGSSRSGGTETVTALGHIPKLLENIAAKAKQVLPGIWEPLRLKADKTVDFGGLIRGFGEVGSAMRPVSALLSGSMHWGLLNVLLPLAGWVLPATGPAMLGVLAGAVGSLAGNLAGVQPLGQLVWEGLLQPMGQWTGNLLIAGLSGASVAFGGLSTVLGGLPAGWEILRGRAATVWTEIRSAMVTAAQGGSSGVLSAFAGLLAGAGAHGEKLRQNLSAVCGKVVKSTGNSLSGISGALTTPFKNGFNGVIELLNKTVSRINRSMTFSWPAIKVAGKTVSAAGKITLAKIPTVTKLAQGGVTTGPTFSLIGEAGREAVLPLERNTGWMDQLAERIAGGLGSRETVIEVHIGGEQLTRQVIRGVNDLTRRTGRCPIYI